MPTPLSSCCIEHFPHLTDLDSAAVRDYAVTQVGVWRFAAYVERNGQFDGKGHVRPAVEYLRRWLERAERARARLGLDPESRIALDLDQRESIRQIEQLLSSANESRRISGELEKGA